MLLSEKSLHVPTRTSKEYLGGLVVCGELIRSYDSQSRFNKWH